MALLVRPRGPAGRAGGVFCQATVTHDAAGGAAPALARPSTPRPGTAPVKETKATLAYSTSGSDNTKHTIVATQVTQVMLFTGCLEVTRTTTTLTKPYTNPVKFVATYHALAPITVVTSISRRRSPHHTTERHTQTLKREESFYWV